MLSAPWSQVVASKAEVGVLGGVGVLGVVGLGVRVGGWEVEVGVVFIAGRVAGIQVHEVYGVYRVHGVHGVHGNVNSPHP